MVAPWKKTTFPALLSNCKLENIFNADEFGLLFQCLITKSYQLSGEKCFGEKSNKVWLTSKKLTGEKFPMFVISKS